MNAAEERYLEDKHTRDTAHALFRTRLARVKEDLAARSVGERVTDAVSNQARAGLTQAVEVAEAHKGVVAGTLAAIVVWLARSPLLGLFGGDEHPNESREP